MKLSDKSPAASDQMTSTQPLLLIDGDLFLFRACAAAEEETDWGDDIWSLSTDLKRAKKGFQNIIEDICTELKSVNFIICLSDRENFRHDVASFYKSGRKKSRKPTGYKAMVEWCMETYVTTSRPKLEADDCMGIMATMPDNKDCVVVSDDKDMKTIPCRLYRPTNREHMVIDEQEADRNFFMQCLTGDITDGYKGLPGIGEKRAAGILGMRPCWELVEAAYIKAGQTYEDALQQARLARILRWTEWDTDKQEVVLWTPPGRIATDEGNIRADHAPTSQGDQDEKRPD
jgi:DNA polymerase-1